MEQSDKEKERRTPPKPWTLLMAEQGRPPSIHKRKEKGMKFIEPIEKAINETAWQIRYGDRRGVAFFMRHGNEQYLATAVDAIPGYPGGTLEFWWNVKFSDFECAILGKDTERGVLVLSSKHSIPDYRYAPRADSSKLLTGGQSVYVLGFPSSEIATYNRRSDNEYPRPLMLKCIVTGIKGDDLLLDSKPIPGFIGSPVLYVHEGLVYVAGIVTSRAQKTTGNMTACSVEKALDLV